MSRYGTAIPLGSGSFADVYRCFDAKLERTVALKFLRWNEPQTAERMFREARAQAKVDHEGVCKVYDTGWLDGRPYIAMQYVEGEDLGTASRDLPLGERIELMIGVAEAVQAAHDRGLVHRDLKPENILVRTDTDGRRRPVVVDFGLVYDPDGTAARMTRTGEPLGTPAFMSPEQAAGRLDQIDARTDVYGLGATLYCVLTGSPPFEGQAATDLLIQAIEKDPVPPRRRDRSLPAEVEKIVLQCLDKEQDRRYASARALAQDLRRFLDGEPVHASRSGWLYPLRRRARKHHRGLAVIGGIVLAASLALLHLEQQARAASQRAEYEQRYVQISNDLDWALRAAQMSGVHDITPSRERVRQRIRELEAELGDLEEVGRGPAHYAIGRAHAALYQDAQARSHLETAWQLGHRTPEVGYFLGLVIGRQYENALERVRHVNASELRTIYLDDAIDRYRDPAKTYLEAGREAEAVSVEYVEALIDFYEDRHEEALQKLEEVKRRVPWLYEADIAEGKVLQRMGDRQFRESQMEASLELYRRAEAALRRAMASASSDPQIYPELCRLLGITLEAEMDWSVPPTDERWAEALEVCDRGLEVDPSSARGFRTSAIAHELMARIALDRSHDAAKARLEIGEAETLAREAVRLEPAEADSHATLARILMTRGRSMAELGDPGDRLELYLSAGESLERAIELSEELGDVPTDPLRRQLATHLQLIASERIGRWQGAEESLERAVELIREELEQAPKSFTLECELGNAEMALVWERARFGRPYEETLAAAEGSYGRCAALNPNYPWAYIGLAEIENTRGAAECRAGSFDGDLPARARERLTKVMELDAGFETGPLRQARFRSTEADCRLLEGRSPEAPLREMEALLDEAEQRGQRVGFWRAMVGTLRLRGLLTTEAGDGEAGRRALESALDQQIGTLGSISDDTGISRRLYRIDRLLWLAEASREVARPNGRLIAEAEGHLEILAAVRDGELLERPEIRVQMSAIRWLEGEPGREARAALARDLRGQLEKLPTMAPHVRPWLRRIEETEPEAPRSPR